MKIRFWFRKSQTNSKTNVGTLYGYLFLDSIRSKEFSTGISVDKKNWDNKNQKIKANPTLDQELQNLKNVLLKAKQKLEFENATFLANDVLDAVLGKKVALKQVSFLEHWYQYIQFRQKKENWSKNTIRNHKTMFSIFTKFLKSENLVSILPNEMSRKVLHRFSIWHNKAPNTFARYVLTIKKILQYCIDNEYIKENNLIFYKVERENRTDKTHLIPLELQKLEAYHTTNPRHQKAKDIFLFLCYTGLNFSDYLRFAQNPQQYIQDDFIVIGRQKMEKKSNQKAYIPLTTKLQNLLNAYQFELPTFKNSQNVNESLKEIGAIVGIEAIKMKTKVGRKTFAHNYLNTTIDRKAVSKMLGHAKTTTLEQYYADVDFEFVKSELKKFFE